MTNISTGHTVLVPSFGPLPARWGWTDTDPLAVALSVRWIWGWRHWRFDRSILAAGILGDVDSPVCCIKPADHLLHLHMRGPCMPLVASVDEAELHLDQTYSHLPPCDDPVRCEDPRCDECRWVQSCAFSGLGAIA